MPRPSAAGLDQIAAEIEAGHFVFKRALEDIHLNIEARLGEIIGPAAGRLHTARSRNDQVATDFRLWVRSACERAEAGLQALQRALLAQAETHAATIMAGFTHMQPAQPVTFGHHCLAYVEMFARDRDRFADRARTHERKPAGRGRARRHAVRYRPRDDRQGAGLRTADAQFARCGGVARFRARLSGRRIGRRHASVAAGRGDRDLGLARLRLYHIERRLSTGSSIMPQKRNPDAAELVRAKSGRILGAFVALTVVMKGLALAYAKDLQEDKEQVFAAADALDLSLAAMAGMVRDLSANKQKMRAAAEAGFPTATDLADWCVRALGKPFREAHHIAGRVVKRAEELGCGLDKVPLVDMQKIEPGITKEVFAVLAARSLGRCAHQLRRHRAGARARTDRNSGGRS